MNASIAPATMLIRNGKMTIMLIMATNANIPKKKYLLGAPSFSMCLFVVYLFINASETVRTLFLAANLFNLVFYVSDKVL